MKKLVFASLAMMFLMFGCNSGNDGGGKAKNPQKSKMALEDGYDYLYHSQTEKALKCFNEAIEYDNGNYEAYYYRGCAYEHLYNTKQALRDWEKAIEINPDYPEPYFNIGLYHRRINDYPMACYYFKLAEKHGRKNMEDYVKYCDYYE